MVQLGATVRIFGPPPVTSAGDVTDLLTPFALERKTDVKGARRLRDAVEAFRPDIVHAQDRRAALAVSTVARIRRVPLVATYHGLPDAATHVYTGLGASSRLPVPPQAALVLAADALVARRCALTITPAAAMTWFLQHRLRVPAKRLLTLYNGVPMHPTRDVPERPSVIMTAGSFSARKAVGVLVEAFIRLAPDHDNIRLLMVGGSAGDQREELQQRLAHAGLAGRAEFTGYRTDVPSLLARADLFVLPSLAETLPLALLEAMGAGLACVASDAGSIAEALPPGTGLLTPAGNIDELEAALRRLLDVPGLATALGKAAAEHARTQFDVVRCAREHLDVYARVITCARGSG